MAQVKLVDEAYVIVGSCVFALQPCGSRHALCSWHLCARGRLREHMAQVCIQAVDSNSVPDEKPSVGEMGTSQEKRMSTSRSQGACAWTESQFWKMDLPCTVLFAHRSLRGSHAAVKFLGTES